MKNRFIKVIICFAVLGAAFTLNTNNASAFFTGISVGSGGGISGGGPVLIGGAAAACTGPLMYVNNIVDFDYSVWYKLSSGSWTKTDNGVFMFPKDSNFREDTVSFRVDTALSGYNEYGQTFTESDLYTIFSYDYGISNFGQTSADGFNISKSGRSNLTVDTTNMKNGFSQVFPNMYQISYSPVLGWGTGYPFCACPSGCISGYWVYYKADYHIDVGVFKEAESVFGLETSVKTNSEAYGEKISSSRTATRKTGEEYTFSQSNQDYFLNGQSRDVTATNDKDGEKFFMGYPLNYTMGINFQNNVYRGLNTKYETYVRETTEYETNYKIDRIANHEGSSENKKVGTLPPPAGENKERPEFSELNKYTLTETNRTLTNNRHDSANTYIKLGTYDMDFCESLTHPTLILVQMTGPTVEEESSTRACAHIYRPYNFDFSISTKSQTSSIIEYAGEIETASVNVTNTPYSDKDSAQEGSPSYSPDNTTVKIFNFFVDPDANFEDAKGGDHGNGDICSFIAGKYGSANIFGCNQLRKSTDGNTGVWSTLPSNDEYVINDNGDIVFPEGMRQRSSSDQGLGIQVGVKIPEDIDTGTKICFVSAINFVDSNYNPTGNGLGYGDMNPNRWRVSNITCRPIAVKPTAQILGGDVIANGGVVASSTAFSGLTFGSWTDYGLVSNGTIDNLASGSYGATGRGTESNINCAMSPMTIANMMICNNGGVSGISLGESGINANAGFIEKIIARFSSSETKEENSGYYKRSGNTSISAILGDDTILDTGTQVIIVENGNLFIDKDLTYSDTTHPLISEIPQRIILVRNGNIRISENVSRIDAWLIAEGGELNTCISSDGSTIYKVGENGISANSRNEAGVCSARLNINGTIVADSVRLNRTNFSTKISDFNSPGEYVYENYAERIQLPMSSILWAYSHFIEHTRTNYSVMYLRELAPRY